MQLKGPQSISPPEFPASISSIRPAALNYKQAKLRCRHRRFSILLNFPAIYPESVGQKSIFGLGPVDNINESLPKSAAAP
jgi:hypothetical protein